MTLSAKGNPPRSFWSCDFGWPISCKVCHNNPTSLMPPGETTSFRSCKARGRKLDMQSGKEQQCQCPSAHVTPRIWHARGAFCVHGLYSICGSGMLLVGFYRQYVPMFVKVCRCIVPSGLPAVLLKHYYY